MTPPVGLCLLALSEELLYNFGVCGEIGVIRGEVAEVSVISPPGIRGKPPLLTLLYKPGQCFGCFHDHHLLTPIVSKLVRNRKHADRQI